MRLRRPAAAWYAFGPKPHKNGATDTEEIMGFLSDEDRARLKPSELLAYETPIPTQVVSSDEYYPHPQTEKQRELQARLLALAEDLAKKQGLSRRRFFQTAAGMAASYVAMNETFGHFFDVTPAEAATPAIGF
jgi:hypothetical protein